MGKFHLFDIDVAQKYGVNAAILLYNISHWIDKNRANKTNYHDGEYWTYNSREAFLKLFPYMTDWQVRASLKTLVDEGLVITGNYNQNAYDRTKWYALTNKGKAICNNSKFDWGDSSNPLEKISQSIGENLQPIPDINTYINTDENNLTFSKEKVCCADTQRIVDAWNSLPSVKPVAKLATNTKRYSMLMARIKDYGIDEVIRGIDSIKRSSFLLGDNRNGWQITFDWFVRPNNFPKVLEGNYLDEAAANAVDDSKPKGRRTAAEIEKEGGTY